ncbi:MAG: hypothetical protein ACC657_05570 [Thiohalomonadales bacterium]
MRVDNANFTLKNSESSKDPRYTIELSFDSNNTDLHYFTSHDDSQVPFSVNKTLGVINGISGTTQRINPDRGLASIGSISIRLVDLNNTISDLFNTKLDIGLGLRGKRVRVYTSFKDEIWNDYVLIQTQIIDTVDYNNGVYILKLADIQRSERKDIFDFAKTTLSRSVDATQLLIPVYSVSKFDLLEHGVSYSDAPNKTVLYIKVEKEIIRCTGTITDPTLGLSFIVDTNGRGVLNTSAVSHIIDSTLLDNSRKTKVEEYVYLEMPIPKLIYAILTGVLYNQGVAVLPSSWHLNLNINFVRLNDFINIGSDWWDVADDAKGIIGTFKGLRKTDAKKFIETELNLLLGCYNPVYSSGELGLRRMVNILAGAGFIENLNESNVISYSSLKHDMRSVLNSFQINWNFDNVTEKFTRTSLIIDSKSISVNGESKLKVLNFKGLDGARHTEETIFSLFNSLRDRYAGPPLKITVNCLPSLNALEVGDIVSLKLENVRDFNGSLASVNRPFEIQSVSINWITGIVTLELFGSSQEPGELVLSTSSSVLNDSFYGTSLKTYLDANYPGSFVDVGGVWHIISNVTLPGAGAFTVYDHNAPVTIDNGVIVTINNNVDIHIRGHFTVNGIIDGKGNGLSGVNAALDWPPSLNGNSGYLGNTRAGGGMHNDGRYDTSYQAKLTTGINDTLIFHNLVNDSQNDLILGLPTRLDGSSGGPGGSYYNASFIVPKEDIGGNGGNSGAGLQIICRGMSFGVSGNIDLSGLDGAPGVAGQVRLRIPGAGAGGAPGACLVLLDGATVNIPDLGLFFTANQGDTPHFPFPMLVTRGNYIDVRNAQEVAGSTPVSSYYVGYGSPGPNRSVSARRIQFIPEDLTAIPDVPILVTTAPTNLLLFSGDNELLISTDGTIISRIRVTWTTSIDQNLGGYELEYKISTDSSWTPVSNTVNLEITEIYISPVKDTIQYDVRIRAINNVGIRSIWLTSLQYSVIGKQTPPPIVNNFTVQRLADGTRVFNGGLLSSNIPLDFAGYEIRAALGTNLAWENLTPLHSGLISKLPYETNQLVAGSYTAGIKAVDTTGNKSTNALLINSDLGSPRLASSILTVDYKADCFPDTKVNCYVDLNCSLLAIDNFTWANFATNSPIITWANWLTWTNNPNTTISYESLPVDLGSVLQFTPLLSALSNATTLLLEESHSDDDITYTAFAVAGQQVSGRYLKTKITATNTIIAPEITQADLIVDAPEIIESITDLDTSTISSPAGDLIIPIVETYSVIKTISVALQNVGAGWSWEIVSKSTTVPRIKLYNASNVLQDALIDIQIRGF